MKKIICLLLAITCLFALTACSGTGASSSAAGSSSGAASSGAASSDVSAPAPAETVVIQVGYENNPGEPLDLGCRAWKEKLDEISDGSIRVDLFPSSQLGSKKDAMDQMQMGENVAYITDGSFLGDYGAPEMSILAGPYLFTEWDQYWKLMETDWWAEQEELLAQNGLHIITGNWAYGVRNLMTTKPVQTLDDLKGLIVRTPQNTIQMKTFEYLGAAPTGMALGDVYTATQQGTIEGMENPMATLFGQAYYEVAKHLTLTRHLLMPSQFVMSQSVWQSLTPEQQTWLTEAADYGGVVETEEQFKSAADYQKQMEDFGVTVYTLSDTEMQRFIDASAAVYDDPAVTGSWRDGLYGYVSDMVINQ